MFIEPNRNASLRHRLWAGWINFWAWLRQPGTDSFGWYFPQTPRDWLSLIFRGVYWVAVARVIFWALMQPEMGKELRSMIPRLIDGIGELGRAVAYVAGRGTGELQHMIIGMPLYEGIPATTLIASFIVYFFLRMNRR